MVDDGAERANLPPVECNRVAEAGKVGDGAVEKQESKPAGRATEVLHPGDGLLAAVTALF